MSVTVRFAPSPTGALHVGGARTALFNQLFALRHGGRLLLRIDDTDRERSTAESERQILEGLDWLGVGWDGAPVRQSNRIDRHKAVVDEMLAKGTAYRCWCTEAELELMRAKARAASRPPRYDGTWRDRDPADGPKDRPYVVRVKAPRVGAVAFPDMTLGRIAVDCAEVDDFVLLRADGAPTYMLATAVDDHDMGVTHVIRGADHLTNAARQSVVFDACGWTRPIFAHVPLILGADGKKLSKRDGAASVEDLQALGIPGEAAARFLLTLGWTPPATAFSRDALAAAFDPADIHRGPARFDKDALVAASFHWIKQADDAELARRGRPALEQSLGRPLSEAEADLFARAMPGLKERAKTFIHLADGAGFYFRGRPVAMEPEAAALLTEAARGLLTALTEALAGFSPWERAALDAELKRVAKANGVGFGDLGRPLRAALSGRISAPGVADILALLGQEESLARLRDALA